MNLGLCQKCDLVHRANELSQSLEDKYKSYGITETIEDHNQPIGVFSYYGIAMTLNTPIAVLGTRSRRTASIMLPSIPNKGPVPSNMKKFLKAKPNNYKGKRKK